MAAPAAPTKAARLRAKALIEKHGLTIVAADLLDDMQLVAVVTMELADLGLSNAATPDAGDSVPAGAAARGYSDANKVFDLRPTVADVAPGRAGDYALFDGLYYDSVPPNNTIYANENGALKIPLDHSVAGQTRDSTPGQLPFLEGCKGFYVEFQAWLSDADPDHWSALWLMPTEHDLAMRDRYPQQYPDDPPNYERWLEIDIDEGGFADAHGFHSLIDWQGVWSKDSSQYWRDPANTVPGNDTQNHAADQTLDRTKPHRFGMSYEPATLIARYYIDDLPTWQATCRTDVANRQHFYVIATAHSHGKNLPYSLFLQRIRAYQ